MVVATTTTQGSWPEPHPLRTTSAWIAAEVYGAPGAPSAGSATSRSIKAELAGLNATSDPFTVAVISNPTVTSPTPGGSPLLSDARIGARVLLWILFGGPTSPT